MGKDKYLTIENVTYIMNKTDSSYEDAEKALKKHKGNKDKAIRWIDSQRRTFYAKARKAFIGLFFYKFIIKKRDKTYINIPLWLLFIVFLITLIGMSNNSYYYFKLEGAIAFITLLIIFVTLLSGCDVVISKREHEAKIRLRNVKKHRREISVIDLEYEVSETNDGKHMIEVDE